MSGQKIIDGLNGVLEGRYTERVIHVEPDPRLASYPTPEEVVAAVIADGRGADADGTPRIGRQTRRKAAQVTRALRDAGWRILR
jgi:hypothetical protein